MIWAALHRRGIGAGQQRTVATGDNVGDVTVRASSVDVRTVVPEAAPSRTCRSLRVHCASAESAGAEPGPAAYNKGGDLPTVTDANVVLGYLPAKCASVAIWRSARISLKKPSSRLRTLGHLSEGAAAGIIDIVNENMYGALR